jgi:hypothetical protein
MTRTWFALASVSALAGFVAAVSASGCTEIVQCECANAADAGEDSAKPDPRPLPPPPPPEEDAGVEGCFAKTAVDLTTIPYEAPLVLPGSCTEGELASFSAYIEGLGPSGSIDVDAWKKTVSATCASCIFTPAANPDGGSTLWGPVLEANGTILDFNRGSCVGIVSNKPACGEAYHKFQACPFVACLPKTEGGAGSCKTQEEFDACREKIYDLSNGPCENARAAALKECGPKVNTYISACENKKYIFESSVRAQCIGSGAGSTDAGADSSTDASSDAGSDGGGDAGDAG